MWIHEFTVRGRGAFPLEMLRHDCCFPKSTEDADKIDDSIRNYVFVENGMLNHVLLEDISVDLIRYTKLKRRGDQMVTIDRWTSLGWRVLLHATRPSREV